MKQPSPRQREALVLVADGKFYPDLVKEDDGWHARWRALGADNEWVDEYVRGPSVTVLSEDAEDQRYETLHDAWAMALRSRTGLVRWDDAECAAFAAELAEWHGGGREDVEARRALCFSFNAASDSGDEAFTLTCPRPRGRAQYRALGQAVSVWGALRGLRSAGKDGRDACPQASAGVSERRPYQSSEAAKYAAKALALFKRIKKFMVDPKMMPAKFEPSFEAQGHSLTMILINVALRLKDVCDDPILDEQIAESIRLLKDNFVHPEFKALLETVGPNGEFIDTMIGRTINPGHAIETSWFLMEVAEKSGDKELLKLALTILDWSLAWGWDKKYGGIISFRDCKNFPPQCYEQDMKFWWPQCETLIATQYAWNLTKKDKWLNWHKKMREWTYKRMPDKKYGEWYGYLHRDGTVAQPAKGNLFKGPFHIPRMMTKSIELANCAFPDHLV